MPIGGWRTRSVFDRYAIITENDIVDAVRKLEADRKQRGAVALEIAATSHETNPSTVAAMLVVVLVGVNPAGGTCPVATVAISGDGASDQAVESPEVKASVGWGEPWSALTREANKSTGCSESELQLSPEMGFPTRIGGCGRWKCRDFPYTSKASVIGEGTGCMQLMSFPGSQETTCR